MAVFVFGFVLRLIDLPGLREVGTVLAAGGAIIGGLLSMYLSGGGSGWGYKRWNDSPAERRARRDPTYESPPRDL